MRALDVPLLTGEMIPVRGLLVYPPGFLISRAVEFHSQRLLVIEKLTLGVSMLYTSYIMNNFYKRLLENPSWT